MLKLYLKNAKRPMKSASHRSFYMNGLIFSRLILLEDGWVVCETTLE